MALIFSLYIESGLKDESRIAIENHFLKHDPIILDGKEYQMDIFSSTNGCSITINGITTVGINTQEECIELSNLGFRFYEILKTAPNFRFAIAGVEVDDFIEYEDLIGKTTDYDKTAGLVISNTIYEQTNNYKNFKEFNRTHKWIEYEGEILLKAFKKNGKWESEIVWSYKDDYLLNN